jgi:hypothetical protein
VSWTSPWGPPCQIRRLRIAPVSAVVAAPLQSPLSDSHPPARIRRAALPRVLDDAVAVNGSEVAFQRLDLRMAVGAARSKSDRARR